MSMSVDVLSPTGVSLSHTGSVASPELTAATEALSSATKILPASQEEPAFSEKRDDRGDGSFDHQRFRALSAYLKTTTPEPFLNKARPDAAPNLPGNDGQSDLREIPGLAQEPDLPQLTGESGDKGSPATSETASTSGSEDDSAHQTSGPAEKGPGGRELSEEELQKVEEMKDRDTEVRTHENQHKSAGGSYAGSPSYTYEQGPDGKRYVTDGEVQIDVSEESTPQKTIEKMQVVRRAALAPATPSAADRQVASEATQKENAARAELSQEQRQSFTQGA